MSRWRRALALAGLVLGAALITACSSQSKARHLREAAVAPVTPRHPSAPSALAQQLVAVRRLARYDLPLFCGSRGKRVVALTFDDGPGVYTRLAIRKLRQFHAKATFFLVGKEVRAWPGLARLEKPYAAFGDHTMTHPVLPALTHAAMVQEIVGARTLIEQTTGEPVVLFRPPYEARTRPINREVRSLGMVEVLWNVDSTDSVGGDYATIERIVLRGLRPGSIVLMHENHGQTIRALPTILSALARDHLRTVTVPQLIATDPPSPRQLRAGLAGCPITAGGSNGG